MCTEASVTDTGSLLPRPAGDPQPETGNSERQNFKLLTKKSTISHNFRDQHEDLISFFSWKESLTSWQLINTHLFSWHACFGSRGVRD